MQIRNPAPKTSEEAEEPISVEVLGSINIGGILESVIPTRAGRFFTQESDQNGWIQFKLWALENGKKCCISMNRLKNPSLQDLCLQYLPHGPVLAEHKDQLILSPEMDFLCRTAQADHFKGPRPLPVGCALSSELYVLIQTQLDIHALWNGAGEYQNKLRVYRREGVLFNQVGTFSLECHSQVIETLCSPTEGRLCIPGSHGVDIWELTRDLQLKLIRTISTEAIFKKNQHLYTLSGMQASSTNEVIALATSRRETSAARPQMLIRINVETGSVHSLTLPTREKGYLEWPRCMPISRMPPLFLIPQQGGATAPKIQAYCILNGETMTLQKLPLKEGYIPQSVTADGHLLAVTINSFQVLRLSSVSKSLQESKEETQTQTQTQTPSLKKGEVRLSKSCAGFHHTKKGDKRLVTEGPPSKPTSSSCFVM